MDRIFIPAFNATGNTRMLFFSLIQVVIGTILLFGFQTRSFSQNVGIGTNAAQKNFKFEVLSWCIVLEKKRLGDRSHQAKKRTAVEFVQD